MQQIAVSSLKARFCFSAKESVLENARVCTLHQGNFAAFCLFLVNFYVGFLFFNTKPISKVLLAN